MRHPELALALSLFFAAASARAAAQPRDLDAIFEASGGAPIVLQKGTYRAKETISLPAGQTLSVEAGASVEFEPGSRLILAGEATFAGTEKHPVTLTGRRGDWGGIEIRGTQTYERLALADQNVLPGDRALRMLDLLIARRLDQAPRASVTMSYVHIDHVAGVPYGEHTNEAALKIVGAIWRGKHVQFSNIRKLHVIIGENAILSLESGSAASCGARGVIRLLHAFGQFKGGSYRATDQCPGFKLRTELFDVEDADLVVDSTNLAGGGDFVDTDASSTVLFTRNLAKRSLGNSADIETGTFGVFFDNRFVAPSEGGLSLKAGSGVAFNNRFEKSFPYCFQLSNGSELVEFENSCSGARVRTRKGFELRYCVLAGKCGQDEKLVGQLLEFLKLEFPTIQTREDMTRFFEMDRISIPEAYPHGKHDRELRTWLAAVEAKYGKENSILSETLPREQLVGLQSSLAKRIDELLGTKHRRGSPGE